MRMPLRARKLDVYFNIDNGTGPIYGWFLQNMPAVRPLFDAWLEPMKPIGARRNVMEAIGSTDHVSFTEAGVPGFNPIQDYVELRRPDAPYEYGYGGAAGCEATSGRRRPRWRGSLTTAAMTTEKIPRPAAK